MSSCGGARALSWHPEQTGGARRNPAGPLALSNPARPLALSASRASGSPALSRMAAMSRPAARRRYQADPKDADVERRALQILLCVRRRRGWGWAQGSCRREGEPPGRRGRRPTSCASNLQCCEPSSCTSLHQRSPTISLPETFLTVQKSKASSSTHTTKTFTKLAENQSPNK